MRLSNKTLKVVINPFSAPLNPDGRACALVPTDPNDPSGAKFVGARLVPGEVTKRPGNIFGDGAKPRVAFDLSAKSFADTPYYREKLKSGELFAQDGAIDRLVGAASVALSEAGFSVEQVEKVWRDQGLGSIVDVFAPQNVTAGDAPAEETVS